MKIFVKIKDSIYIIIPMICIGLWTLVFLIGSGFNLIQGQWDAIMFYLAGKQILFDPAMLYDYFFNTYGVYWYDYMPSLAVFYSVISLSGYYTSFYILFLCNCVFFMLIIIEFNKLLILLNIDQKFYRFLFLMIISNGELIYRQFYMLQVKVLIALVLIFIIRREIQLRKENKEKDIKYYLITYNLFIFILGIAPYFIFFIFLIYIFQDIRLKDTFKKNNVKKYGLIIMSFIIQNFLFIIYPNLISGYFQAITEIGIQSISPLVDHYLIWQFLERYIKFLRIISLIILLIITLILIFNHKLKIENKFSIFTLLFIPFNVFTSKGFLIFCLPFSLLFFVPFFKKEENILESVKKNKIFLIGLFSVSGIYLMCFSRFTCFEYFPFLRTYPLYLIPYFRYVFFLSIMIICLLLLYTRKNKNIIKIKD